MSARRPWALAAALLAAGCDVAAPQVDECKKYLACVEAVSPGSSDSLKDAYGENGTCWAGSASTADTCRARCRSGLEALKNGNPTRAECQ